MTDLVAFLRARLDEDEGITATIPENERVWQLDGTILYGGPMDDVVDWVYVEGGWEHIARHDPARVLAEIDAKRRIVDECAEENLDVEIGVGISPEQWLAQRVLLLLALPWRDHPDYRPEWSPDPEVTA